MKPQSAHQSARIRPLRGWAELRECVRLQDETWGAGFSERVPATILRLAQRLGGVASGAFDESGRMIGFVFGLPGMLAGDLVHWSDMLAVRADQRNRGVGEALKRHQRDMLLRLGVDRICWTFEPLESRNAYLNIARLGGVSREYARDFYGDSDSPLHGTIGTDRLLVVWDIASERVERRLAGLEPPPSAAEVEAVPLINETTSTPVGPRSEQPRLDLEEPRLRLAIPADIQSIREAAPDLASEWRHRTRAALETFLGRGYVVDDFVRAGETSWYLLATQG